MYKQNRIGYEKLQLTIGLPVERRDVEWYLALAPPQHFLGKTWPGSGRWLVHLLRPLGLKPVSINQRQQQYYIIDKIIPVENEQVF